MRPKHNYLIVDTETTVDNLVADFGAIVCDRQGNILAQCAVLIRGVFDKPRKHTLFWNDKAGDLWSKANLQRRYDIYGEMLESGARQYATVRAINAWIDKVIATYNPTLTAYNLAFDSEKCANTEIDLSGFESRFCLMQAAQTQWAKKRKYLAFVLGCHAFNPPTRYRNMTYQTKAEVMAAFVQGHPIVPEPHTALEDTVHFELPILVALLQKRSRNWLLTEPRRLDWRDTQVRDYFQPKKGRR